MNMSVKTLPAPARLERTHKLHLFYSGLIGLQLPTRLQRTLAWVFSSSKRLPRLRIAYADHLDLKLVYGGLTDLLLVYKDLLDQKSSTDPLAFTMTLTDFLVISYRTLVFDSSISAHLRDFVVST